MLFVLSVAVVCPRNSILLSFTSLKLVFNFVTSEMSLKGRWDINVSGDLLSIINFIGASLPNNVA